MKFIQSQFRDATALLIPRDDVALHPRIAVSQASEAETREKGKSSAQVETLVTPAVSLTSCELKLKDSRRQNPLTVRLSDIEREIVKAKARTVGISTNAYMKAASLGSHYKPPSDPVLTKALLALSRELTAQGNNLNQIARHLNSGISSAAESDSLLGVIARSMLTTHKAIRQALTQGEGPMP